MDNLFGSICLSDIPRELIRTSEKNGKKYITISVQARRAPSQYGYTHNIKAYAKRGEVPEGTNLFIGELKPSQYQDSYQQPVQTAPTAQPAPQDDEPPF